MSHSAIVRQMTDVMSGYLTWKIEHDIKVSKAEEETRKTEEMVL